VDLCFVPASHEVSEKIPAVSGSSGRLVVARAKEEKESEWPGRVFGDEQLSYEEAMLKFVVASQAKEEGIEQKEKEKKGLIEPISAKETRHLLKKEEQQLQNERRQGREQRKLEDTAWGVVPQLP
jgi:hypothetical protein